MSANSHQMLCAAWTALELPAAAPDAVRFVGVGDLPSYFATTDLAAASGAGLAVRHPGPDRRRQRRQWQLIRHRHAVRYPGLKILASGRPMPDHHGL